jgi:hypothetical protein
MDVQAAAEDWRRPAAVALAMARIVDDQSAGFDAALVFEEDGEAFRPGGRPQAFTVTAHGPGRGDFGSAVGFRQYVEYRSGGCG